MTPAQKRFVEDMGQQMLGWGLARTTGRIYAYLLLRSEPASLDEIARELRIAKSGASVSTRHLMGFGLARSSGEPGTRRLRYAANHDLNTILVARAKQMQDFITRLHQGAAAATAAEPKRHLRRMSLVLEKAMDEITEVARRTEKGRPA
jgi:DNA-binding transcriptional regulator GbsR (MarR family)